MAYGLGAYSLGAYSLGAYSMGVYILGPAISSHRFRARRATHWMGAYSFVANNLWASSVQSEISGQVIQ